MMVTFDEHDADAIEQAEIDELERLAAVLVAMEEGDGGSAEGVGLESESPAGLCLKWAGFITVTTGRPPDGH